MDALPGLHQGTRPQPTFGALGWPSVGALAGPGNTSGRFPPTQRRGGRASEEGVGVGPIQSSYLLRRTTSTFSCDIARAVSRDAQVCRCRNDRGPRQDGPPGSGREPETPSIALPRSSMAKQRGGRCHRDGDGPKRVLRSRTSRRLARRARLREITKSGKRWSGEDQILSRTEVLELLESEGCARGSTSAMIALERALRDRRGRGSPHRRCRFHRATDSERVRQDQGSR